MACFVSSSSSGRGRFSPVEGSTGVLTASTGSSTCTSSGNPSSFIHNTQSHQESAKRWVYALGGATYLFRLACNETVVFAIDVKIVLRHDSKVDFRARASKHLFCTRRKRTEMTGLVEYRRAHDDRQQAQKRGNRITTTKGGESSAHIQGMKKGGSVRYRISDTEG